MALEDSAPESGELAELRLRVTLLEEQNQRLQEKLEPMYGPDNPCFDARKFLKALNRTILLVTLPMYLMAALLVPLMFYARQYVPNTRIGPLRLIDVPGRTNPNRPVAVGVLAFGGAAFGVIAIGGMSAGIIAFGGGAIGVIAVGGGSIGVLAFGGGACGLIAIGGGACGWLALGQRGYGKHVLALNRQDDRAVEFFSRWVPGVRNAVTRPMPVIPLSRHAAASSG